MSDIMTATVAGAGTTLAAIENPSGSTSAPVTGTIGTNLPAQSATPAIVTGTGTGGPGKRPNPQEMATALAQFGELAPGLRGARIEAPRGKAKKGKPSKMPTPQETVQDRDAALETIAHMKERPRAELAPGHFDLSLSHDVGRLFGGTNETVGKGNVAPIVKTTINTLGRHLLGRSFTIDKSNLTTEQWDRIAFSAQARLDERKKQEQVANAQQGAQLAATEARGRTGTVSATALYDSFIKTYLAAGESQTKRELTALNDQLVNMGLIDTHTPTPKQVGEAYSQLIEQARRGHETATQAIAKQVESNATAIGQAATATTPEAVAAYYREQFTNLATEYQVPYSKTALNTLAASAAQKGTTYEVKADQVAAFTTHIKNLAKGLYPTLAPQIQAGYTVKDLVDPYAQLAASLLGYGTSSTYSGGASASTSEILNAEGALGVTWAQPKWSVFLQGGKAATGVKPAPMTLDQARQHIISTPQYGWQKTAAAYNLGQSAADKLAEDFGFVKT